MSYEETTVLSTLSKIQTGELVLPAIQRDFVWEPERMYKLLDSIFRGYPFSTLLFWNTKQRIQYRQFTKDWSADYRFTFQVKPEGKKGTMVLDGQQRLQTMYLAIYGSYDQKVLYFDLLSGIEPDDISQAKYHFEFLSSAEAEKRNEQNLGIQHWVPLRDLANLSSKQITVRTIHYINLLKIPGDSDAGQRLSQNVSAAFGALRVENSLNYFTIDKEYGEDSLITNLDEVLEIFVRVNSGGQVLSKSDLMFSLMQMLWEGAADAISDLIETLNAKGRYDFDKDFILKCALVCSGKGARYEVSKLRDEKTVRLIEENFEALSFALENCMDFVVNQCRLVDDRILRSYNTLIPFVYFFFKQPKQQVRGEDTLLHMKQSLYLALMTSVYSRFADNYIDQTTRNILDIAHDSQPGVFPVESFTRFIYEKTGHYRMDDGLLQANVSLLMNILEGGTRLPEGRRTKRPEVDHIFPQSKLRARKIPEELINHFANFRLISKPDNIWKSDQDPAPYFSKHPQAAVHYYIPVKLLEYKQYNEFLKRRQEKIWQQLNRVFGLDGSELSPEELSLLQKPSTQQPQIESSLPEPKWYKTSLEMLTADDQAHPILNDHTSWWDVFRQMGYEPRWSGRYYWALRREAGIRNVADFANAIMAFHIKPKGRSSGQPMYQFSRPLPDGNKLSISSREFGGYAWKAALEALKQRGLTWKNYLDK